MTVDWLPLLSRPPPCERMLSGAHPIGLTPDSSFCYPSGTEPTDDYGSNMVRAYETRPFRPH